MQNLPQLNLLRGIAALMVVLFHLTCFQGVKSPVLSEGNWLRSLGSHGDMGVYLFFVISGFVIPYSMHRAGYTIRNAGRFLLKRLARLEPPYIACLVLTLLVNAYLMHKWGQEVHLDPVRILLHIGYLIPFTFGEYEWYNIIFWTLAIEFCFYLLMALVFPLFTHRFWWVKVLVFLAFLIAPFCYSHGGFLPRFLPVFLAGILVFLYHTKQINAWFLVGFGGLTLMVLFYQNELGIGITTAVAALAILFLRSDTRVGNFLGDISYSIYLMHGMLGIIPISFACLEPHSDAKGYLWIIICTALSIVGSWIFSRIIERPSKQLSQRIVLKKG